MPRKKKCSLGTYLRTSRFTRQ